MREMFYPARLLVTAALLATPCAAQIDGAPWRDLFDGKTLDGWRGPDGLFRVEQGVLVGSTEEKRIPRNRFLVYVGAAAQPSTASPDAGAEVFGDFEVEIEVRVLGANNSGIQYRARYADADRLAVHGYQADIHPNPPYCGMLYEEGGRGIVAERGQSIRLLPDGTRDKKAAFDLERKIAIDDWHVYRVIAEGKRLRHFIDDQQTVEVIDESPLARTSGILALQLHAGTPMRIEVRSVRIREAKKPVRSDVAAEAVTKQKQVSWIWLGDATQGDVVYFRRSFEVAGAARQDTNLIVACDNRPEVYLDGKKVLESGEWYEASRLALNKLSPGKHVLAVRATNEAGPAGLALKLGDHVQSDASWRASRAEVAGWQGNDFDDGTWEKAREIGELGIAPWGEAVSQAFASGAAPAQVTGRSTPADELQLAVAGFGAERLVTVPKSFGSWVALARASKKDEYYASDQQSGLYRIRIETDTDGLRTTIVEREPVDIGGAQGLYAANERIYAFVNAGKSGLFEVTDSDGDGRFDTSRLRLPFVGSGEHGVHAIVPTPDERGLYLVCGNHVALPEVATTQVPLVFGEDHLPPTIPDPNRHANGIKAPGGFILRFDFASEKTELVAVGFRNVYDIALDAQGEIFAYDADMEWDFGMPWYRPTRVLHVLEGADFGWRTGSAKWSKHAEDSLPPLLEIGPGSPTALVFGHGTQFPAAWQERLFAFDWTFGTIWSVRFERAGRSYRATSEVFASGKPMPFTDAVVGHDGALYCITGGRGTETRLYRIAYDEDSELVTKAGGAARQYALLSDSADLDLAWSRLGSPDRALRHLGRTRIEVENFASWRAGAMEIDAAHEPLAAAVALVAYARHMERKDRDAFFERIAALPFASMEREARLAVLRAAEIALHRHGRPRPSIVRAVVDILDPLFPNDDLDVDAELARVLCGLGAESALEKCLAKLATRDATEAPAWLSVLERNDRYGAPIRRMLENPPPTRALHYVDCLRMIDRGFDAKACARVLGFLQRARRQPGGASYRGFIDAMRDVFVEKVAPGERAPFASILANWQEKEERFQEPRGPGREWTIPEALAVLEAARESGELERSGYREGRNLFFAIGCARCHHVDGEGGGIGPDLSSTASKFSWREILESVIEPQKVIADQYVAKSVRLRSGKRVVGQVASDPSSDAVLVWPAQVDAEPVRIAKSDIEAIEAVSESPMPAQMLNRLSREELVELFAFLIGSTKR